MLYAILLFCRFLAVQKIFSFGILIFINSCYYELGDWSLDQKVVANAQLPKCFSMFSSSSFKVSDLVFRSLTCFESFSSFFKIFLHMCVVCMCVYVHSCLYV